MENIVYNELINRGYQVDVGMVSISEKNENENYVRKQLEVDFVCNLGYERIYIQSALNIDEVAKKRARGKIPNMFHLSIRSFCLWRIK